MDPATMGLADQATWYEADTGVPADLMLAVAWLETGWTVPEASHDEHHPALVGVAALRINDARPAVERALEALDADKDAMAAVPELAFEAAFHVMRAMALERFEMLPEPADWQSWLEVAADYVGLEEPQLRQLYLGDLAIVLGEGISGEGPMGEEVSLEPRGNLSMPELPSDAGEAGGAGQYGPARWALAHSSNHSRGRFGERVRYVIIHTVQGSYSSAINWFKNPAANASAHYIVSSGGAVAQTVDERNAAWHAGNWTYNKRSIGIEHEGYVSQPSRWYTDAMYKRSAALTRYLCQKYGIPMDRRHIIGHNEVPGATHTDPGSGWNWTKFMRLVRGESNGGGGGSCSHSFGGSYADQACSASYQCCDGRWRTRGSCGSCVCVERSGETGCRPKRSCDHTFGGDYGHKACSPSYQCCDGRWRDRGSCGSCSCTERTGERGCGT